RKKIFVLADLSRGCGGSLRAALVWGLLYGPFRSRKGGGRPEMDYGVEKRAFSSPTLPAAPVCRELTDVLQGRAARAHRGATPRRPPPGVVQAAAAGLTRPTRPPRPSPPPRTSRRRNGPRRRRSSAAPRATRPCAAGAP